MSLAQWGFGSMMTVMPFLVSGHGRDRSWGGCSRSAANTASMSIMTLLPARLGARIRRDR